MKVKSLLLLSLIVVSLIGSTVPAFAGPKIVITLVVGRTSLGCDKFGICSGSGIELGVALQLEDNTGDLIITYKGADINNAYSQYFRNGSVTYEELYTFNRNTSTQLGSTNLVAVPQGTYSYTVNRDGDYEVRIPQ